MRVLVVLLIGTLLSTGSPAPASAVPPTLGLSIRDAPNDQPFVGETFFAQSDPILTIGGRASWTCHVDFGDGATGGYWRAPSYASSAPCAAFHDYAAPGTYTVVMTVTDPDGGTTSEQVELEVGTRPVTTRDAGVEGAPVTLTAPAGATATRWSIVGEGAGDPCDLDAEAAETKVLTCHRDGSYRVHYDTGSAATSGAYDVTWTNGAPRPTMQARRTLVKEDGTPYYVPVRRVGTGDQVRFDVTANDPSTSGTQGDPMTCVYHHGNGLREVQTAYEPDGSCNGQTSYLAPGRRTSRVRVTDDDGAVGKARATVVVVRRDVRLAVRDIRRGGTRGVIFASLTPRGLRGRVDLRFPDGRSLVATRLTSIQVAASGSVSLLGRARVDGKGGYGFVAFPDRSYPQGIAFSVYAWRVGRPSTYVVNQTVHRDEFRVRLHAPPVS